MDFMGESGMPPDMMESFSDIATGVFDQYMGDNPDAAPMEAFDAVGAGIDHHMADMPPDIGCADMAGDFPPPPEDFGAFGEELNVPSCGSFEGGESYEAQRLSSSTEGGMADMMDTARTTARRQWQDRVQTKVDHLQEIWLEIEMGTEPGPLGWWTPGGDPVVGEPGPLDGGPGGDPMGEPGPMDGGPGGDPMGRNPGPP